MAGAVGVASQRASLAPGGSAYAGPGCMALLLGRARENFDFDWARRERLLPLVARRALNAPTPDSPARSSFAKLQTGLLRTGEVDRRGEASVCQLVATAAIAPGAPAPLL
jgi:hypothetical protein